MLSASSPLQPYSSENVDEEYLLDVGVVVSLRNRCVFGESAMSNRLFEPVYQGRHVDVEKHKETIATANKVDYIL